jgi:predicted anti-sigma-YlaC factor YlaD
LVGLVLLEGVFDTITAFMGVATGILGILAAAGSFYSASLSGIAIIFALLLTMVWVPLAGYRPVRLG